LKAGAEKDKKLKNDEIKYEDIEDIDEDVKKPDNK